jgi:carbon storage regulator
MLVLSRKRGEGIVIGNGLEVTVVEVRGQRVTLGIAAPPDVPIHREEVARRIAGNPLDLRPVECA